MATSSEQLVPSERLPALKVGESLPKAMGPQDMQRAFGWSEATFYRRQRTGELKPFLLPRHIGPKRYSGEKVQTFLNGRSSS